MLAESRAAAGLTPRPCLYDDAVAVCLLLIDTSQCQVATTPKPSLLVYVLRIKVGCLECCDNSEGNLAGVRRKMKRVRGDVCAESKTGARGFAVYHLPSFFLSPRALVYTRSLVR